MINFYSTNNKNTVFPLKEAVLSGLAPDGGLFMPTTIPTVDAAFIEKMSSLSLQEIALEVASLLMKDHVPIGDLKRMIEESITFDAPLVQLSNELYALELFYGPTLSFKDFGSRFMARLMAYFNRQQDRELHILVATSGDTGSAVAQGFFDLPGIKVWILYPKGQVSAIQEKQLTTLGHNVTALEVEGTFDDCQALVKRAFNDKPLCQKLRLTSANSINIARLIPQIFYYFYAYAQLKKTSDAVVVSVPSGNFGNLTAGLIAKRMGLPIAKFIAATNINDSVPKYLETGEFHPHPSRQTLSNAMDVGNPSNFARILDLYQGDLERIRYDIFGVSFTDLETKSAIIEIKDRYDYIADPHGAVAYLGLEAYRKKINHMKGIFLETAHPAKFLDIVEPLIGKSILVPERLQQSLDKKKESILLSNNYEDLVDLL